MRTINDFFEFGVADPDWENLKYVWGSGRKMADQRMINKLKLKIEGIKEDLIREKQRVNPAIRDFSDIPVGEKDSVAQALVIAVLKAFYEADAGSGRMVDPRALGMAQNAPVAPQM